jgi:hypothetical protein
MEIVHCYISSGHSFKGRTGLAPADCPMREVAALECVAGCGLRGDRYFKCEENHKGQITFFAAETHEWLCANLGVTDKPPSAFRRNVITRGADLNALIGVEFEVQGVSFLGVEEAKPCRWMNTAFHPAAEDALRGRGGLRARILSDGVLRSASRPAESAQR